MKIRNIPFRVESELVRLWHRWRNSRPSSEPYLSGDGFRALTAWRYEIESRRTFDPGAVPPESLVFCDAWLLEEFLKTVAPRLRGQAKVLSSNGDPTFTNDKLAWIPPTVSILWTQNCEVAESRVAPLPIGLENANLHANGIVRDFDACRRKSGPRKNRVLWGFAEVTNPLVREKARLDLERCPVADHVLALNSRAYRAVARQYRFIASPPGNGPDCHRTWEAMYLRAIPIVLRSTMTQRFSSQGFPLWLVDSYEDLAGVTEGELERRYTQLAPGFDHPALWMDHWKKVFVE